MPKNKMYYKYDILDKLRTDIGKLLNLTPLELREFICLTGQYIEVVNGKKIRRNNFTLDRRIEETKKLLKSIRENEFNIFEYMNNVEIREFKLLNKLPTGDVISFSTRYSDPIFYRGNRNLIIAFNAEKKRVGNLPTVFRKEEFHPGNPLKYSWELKGNKLSKNWWEYVYGENKVPGYETTRNKK